MATGYTKIFYNRCQCTAEGYKGTLCDQPCSYQLLSGFHHAEEQGQ